MEKLLRLFFFFLIRKVGKFIELQNVVGTHRMCVFVCELVKEGIFLDYIILQTFYII